MAHYLLGQLNRREGERTFFASCSSRPFSSPVCFLCLSCPELGYGPRNNRVPLVERNWKLKQPFLASFHFSCMLS